MTFNRFKVLTFDIVGTLIDFETGVLNAFRDIGGKSSENLTDDQIFAPYVTA
ncbi:MAG: HAD family hydrolase, partial [Mesorhizobium sp.]